MLDNDSEQQGDYEMPLIDQNYIKQLQIKRKQVEERQLERRLETQKNQELQMKKLEKTLEYLIKEAPEFEKRNTTFLSNSRKQIQKFHREIARVYAADQNLRETRDVYLDYIRKNRPILARSMDLNLRDSKRSNVKILVPQIRDQLIELKKYEMETEQMKQELRSEELKKNINDLNMKQKGQLRGDGRPATHTEQIRPISAQKNNDSYNANEKSMLDEFTQIQPQNSNKKK